MVERIFTVLFVRVKNCFCYLSANNLKDINTGETVRLTYDNNDKFAFLSVGASTSANIPDYAIGINSLFAKQLGLNENENVILGQQPKLPIVKSISICPLYKSDYEILELLSQTVQSTLLHQIRTVYKNQRFVIWIGDSIFVYAQIETVYPMSPGLLDNLSEVVIKPPQKFDSSMQCPKIIPNNMTNNKNTFKEGMCPIITENSIQNYTVFYQKSCTEVLNSIVTEIVPFTNAQEDIYKYSLENKLVYRALSINSDHLEAKVHNYVFPFNIFVLRKSLPQSFQEINTLEECLVLQIKLLNSECFDETQLEKQLFVRLYSMEDLLDEKYIDNINLDSVLVHDSILNYFNCYSGTRLILERITKGSFVEEIVIRGKKSFVVDLKESLQTFLADQCKTNELILNSKFVLNLKENVNCMLEFLPVEATYCFVDKAFLRKCKFSSVDQAVSFTKKEPDTKNTEKYLSNVSNISDLIGQCVKKLEMDVMNKRGELETFILVGKTGTGKSTIIQLLEEKLELPPLFCYTEIMQCKSIKGKTIDSLQKLFTTIFTNLTLHQPSVLILDDLHVLCENINDGDALAQNALYVNRISEMICNLLTTYIKQNQISIIATTESLDKLNKHIYSSRGNYLFSNILEINNLNKSDRLLLLEHLFGNYKAIDLNLEEIGIKTDGFVIQDMVDFTKKTIFESLKDDTGSCQNHIKMEHCERALENTTVLSLQDIKLCESDAKDFTSIGGLHDVKKTLIESLSWPLKYPELFKNAPLRPQSGLLLFGPPGTGKTLIAGAVAQQCSLRLISVKGPELLSKYIGASEQSVRDVFQKAQNARPCILFFDEFDSLAPRRGHDNTGVTDRVVNQLLTQLDGVESLSGVFVLAATSRPDLLDPALLRPGRLDKQILCALPDQVARMEILQALSQSMKFAKDVDLIKIASQSEGFSGADLQSILYSAHLSSVEHFLSSENNMSSKDTTFITQKMLELALRNTRPSLSPKEIAKYNLIYSRFFTDKTKSKERIIPGTKATLA